MDFLGLCNCFKKMIQHFRLLLGTVAAIITELPANTNFWHSLTAGQL